jgi:putative aminopeptidase FrvX
MYIRLDEMVSSREDVEKLGISIGNFVHFDPRPVRTDSGFIKSRHLDDKAGVAILMGVASKLAEQEPPRTVHFIFTVHEEVGHGGAGFDPGDATDMIVVDMGVAGKGRESSERKVTICAADSSGPFNYQLTKQLIKLAEANEIPFAVDTFPYYNSDAAATLKSGLDARHALVGPGIDSSHAMERTHIEGIMATVNLLTAYVSEQ